MKGNNIMTSLLLFACFAMYVAIELKMPCKDNEKECGANTKRLEAQNELLKERYLKLNEKYLGLRSKADSLQGKLASTHQTLVRLKNKRDEKINSIDSLDSNELYGFFSKFDTESASAK